MRHTQLTAALASIARTRSAAAAIPLLLAAWHLPVPAEAGFDLQKRIHEAGAGEVVIVPAGHYSGNFVIDKPLVLIGENGPHLDGEGRGKVVRILAPDVTIQGFRISGSGLNLSADDAAIHITGDRAVIIQNEIHDSLHGVYVRAASGVRVENNRVRGIETTVAGNLGVSTASDGELCSVSQDRRGNGLHFWNSSGHLITGNEISNTRDGIYFSFTRQSRIENNRVYGTRYGLHYMYSDGNFFSNNRFSNSVAGAAVMYSKELVMHRNHFADNRGSRAFGLLLHSVDFSMIRENRMTGNRVGISMQSSHVNESKGNHFDHNYIGMRLTSSSTGNLFHENRIGLNLHPIALAGRDNQNRWDEDGRGNYWAGATVLDINADGVSQLPHRATDLLGDMRESFPFASLLTESPALKILQFALRRAPVPNTHFIADRHPLMRAPE